MDDKVRAKMLEAFYLTQTTITDDPIERAIALIHAVRAMCDEQDFVDRRPAPTKQPTFEEAREAFKDALDVLRGTPSGDDNLDLDILEVTDTVNEMSLKTAKESADDLADEIYTRNQKS